MRKINMIYLSAVTVSCLLAFTSNISAGLIPVPGGYQVNYGISMEPGSSNGSDLESVFIFEWDDSNFSAEYGGTISGTGNTYLSHVIDFSPTSALIMGYGAGIPGNGDEKNHLYTVTSLAFSYTVGGLKWSEAFPGIPPDPRVGHNAMINLLIDAEAGASSALTALSDFVMTEGYRAGFNPRGGFVVLEWTGCDEGEIESPPGSGQCIPVGGSIPEPTTLALLGLCLAGIGYQRRRKVSS